MADSLIGSLRVLLGLDTAAFSDGIRKANSQMSDFAKSIGTIAAGIQLQKSLEGAVKGLYDLTIGSIKAADELGKAAQKFGIPVEELSKLKFAADLSDVSLEALEKGLGKLSKALTEAAAKPTSEAANAFKALSVSISNTDGTVKSSEQALLDIAKRFSELKDGAGKTAVAMALFGKSGADLIPLLNQGKTGITALMEEAQKLGIVIDKETAAKAEQFNDTLKRLATGAQALGLRIAAALLDPLQKLADIFIAAQGQGRIFDSIIKNLITETDIQAVQSLVVAFENLGRIFSALKGAAGLLAMGEVTAAMKLLDDAVAANIANIDKLNYSFSEAGKRAVLYAQGVALLKKAFQESKKPQDDFNYAALGGKNALDQFLDSQKKSTAATIAQAQTVGLAGGQLAFLKTTLEALAVAEANGIAITNQRRDAIIAAANAAGMAAAQLAANQAIQDALPEYEKLQQKVVEIQNLMSLFPDKANQMAAALAKSQMAVQNLVLSAAATALGQLSDMFLQFGKSSKAMFEVGKALAIAQATINTYQAATKALAEWGWPLGAVFAAAAVAAGIAQVAKISATKFQGAAFGGSFKVPGGSMSTDTKLIPMMLAPGERVDVTPASRAGGESRELVIPAIKPKDFFTGETVREMVFAIDQWMKDGGTGIRLAT